MKKKTDRSDNRGFTLVELLVAIAILSIIVGAVIGFFMRTMRMYHRGNEESDLQNEAQMTMTQLENLVVNASQGVGLNPSLPNTQTNGDELFVYNRYVDDTSGAVSYKVTHIYVDDRKLKYCYMDFSRNGSGVYVLSDDKKNPQTLSEYIDNFMVDVSKLVSKNRVRFTIDFRTRGGREYKTDNTVLLRNKVLDKTNGQTDEYFAESITEDERNEVTAMELSPNEFSMWAGTSAANPFTPVYKKADNTISDKGSAVWTFDPLVGDADINRATGAITLGSSVRGDLTVRATDQGSLNRGGSDEKKYVFANATVHVKSAEAAAILTAPAQQEDNLSVATANFTIIGANLTKADLGAIQPTVMSGSSQLAVTITADEAHSDFSADTSKLCYTVRVNRPGNYLGKEYSLGIRATVPGNAECVSNTVTWKFIATPGDEDKVVSAVRLVDTEGRVNSEGGSVSVSADRGESLTLIMYVKYKDKDGNETDFTPLPSDSWSIKQSGTSSAPSANCSIVPGGSDYSLHTSAQDYAKDFSMDFTTTYSSGKGQEAEGPALRLNFSRVKFSVKNVLGEQKVFPVTAGKTSYIQFDVQGLKNGVVFVQSGNSTSLSITPSGEMASVTAKSNASVDTDYTFGLKDSKGHVLEGVTCSITIWPDPANTAAYNGNKQDDAVYIPTVNDINNFDPTKTVPETGRTTTIFMPDGEKITYTNTNKTGVDGSNHKYWAEYNGKTYYYVTTAHQWRLNEK